jgi:hypothetical protein
MASKLEQLQEQRRKIIEQKVSEIKKQKIEELQITAPEPGLLEIAKEDLSMMASSAKNTLSNVLFWPFYSTKTSGTEEKAVTQVEITSQPEVTSRELSNAYSDIEQAVNAEIADLSEQIDISAFNDLASEVISELGEKASEALSVTNLRIYLTAICQIKRPTYVFNQTDGFLYIKDPARSRTHLKVLAQNVISYYDTVMLGVQSIENGEVEIDIPSDERKLNMKSLLEKSQAIVEILTNYDTGLTSSFLDTQEPDNIRFFEKIAKMWSGLKNQSIEALSQFPITEREKEIERTRQKEATILALRDEMNSHELDMQRRLQELAHNKELTNLTEAEWTTLNQWFSINTGGVLKMGTGLVDNVINATTDMGNNAIANAKKLADTGMSGILSIIWGIAVAGMVLTIPAVLYLSIKTGYVTAVFNERKRRLDTQGVVEEPIIIPVPNPTNPDDRVIVSPPQDTGLTVNPDTSGIAALLRAFELTEPDYGPHGKENYDKFLGRQEPGEEYEPDRVYGGKLKKNKKTRKNKKRKTRKLKHGKRRQTKNRNRRMRPTKRH